MCRTRASRTAIGRLAGAVVLALLTLAAGGGCAGSASGSAPGQPRPAPELAPAPWSGERLRAAEVPGVYLTEWRRAENRSTCALVAPRALGAGYGAVPRAATFSGGWAVAYDLPEVRSAFGVAGTGADAADAAAYAEWPHRLRWSDGSSADYGPEGGTGPSQLAYLRIARQACLYNVWSRLGRAHLERLLAELRFVDG